MVMQNRARNVFGTVSAVVVLFFASFSAKAQTDLQKVFSIFSGKSSYFQPHHNLSGIGVDRSSMDDATLQVRTNKIIAAQTFNIMRYSDGKKLDAEIWARAITAPAMQKIFANASRSSGFPIELLEAITFIESGGDPTAHSPTGPRGPMQMTTRIGKYLHLEKTEIKTVKVARKSRSKKRPVLVIKRRVIIVDDERENSELAIPAGANLLADMARYYQSQYNLSPEVSQQFAVWEWHPGRSVVNEALGFAQKGGIKNPTMAKVFFLCSPEHNPALYGIIQTDLEHDYGPTYWFRVMRAEQLLELYRTDRDGYIKLMTGNKSTVVSTVKAASRLEVWYSLDRAYQDVPDLKIAIADHALVSPPNNPPFFSYALRMNGPEGIGAEDVLNRDLYATDPPAVVGTLIYVAAATRKGWERSHPRGEKFVPLEVTSMVRTAEYQRLLNKHNANSRTTFPSHTVGAVDISFAKLPPGEEKWLHCVIEDMGWDEYLGYFDEHMMQKTMHFAPSPEYVDFFNEVYNEAADI
jgi:hypothetical protein